MLLAMKSHTAESLTMNFPLTFKRMCKPEPLTTNINGDLTTVILHLFNTHVTEHHINFIN